jgi:hypothetical protein
MIKNGRPSATIQRMRDANQFSKQLHDEKNEKYNVAIFARQPVCVTTKELND